MPIPGGQPKDFLRDPQVARLTATGVRELLASRVTPSEFDANQAAGRAQPDVRIAIPDHGKDMEVTKGERDIQ